MDNGSQREEILNGSHFMQEFQLVGYNFKLNSQVVNIDNY